MSTETDLLVQSTGIQTTEEYCGLGKNLMAAKANICVWPMVPPDCTITWSEYVGQTATLVSQVFFFLVFFYLFIQRTKVEMIIMEKQKKQTKTFWNRTANEWNNFYNFLV